MNIVAQTDGFAPHLTPKSLLLLITGQKSSAFQFIYRIIPERSLSFVTM